MVFTSFNFLIFFPILAILYWITPSRFRWVTLLAASYYFYINIRPVYALLVAGVTLTTYVFTTLMAKTADERHKRFYLIINILLVLLPLFFFKYFGAVNNAVFGILENWNIRWPLPEMRLILPIGISFYTFMAIGYMVDVYNEDITVERNPGILGLFVSFFPLILSGPIERAGNMLPQFRKPPAFDYDLFSKGLKLALWGYYMKLVVAERLGMYVNAVYSNVEYHNGSSLLVASLIYPFQVYADLGGYSLIAIGVANVLGIRVIQNFNRPFFAGSMSEFWRRWHISLISWLTDYVYTPLSFAFRRYKVWGIVIALMITFMISGIWHGAALTFVVWGLMQGIFLSTEALTNKRRSVFEAKHGLNRKAWYLVLSMGVTYFLFSVSQIFGRADNLDDAFLVFRRIFTDPGPLFLGPPSTFINGSIALALLMLKDFFDEFRPGRLLLFDNPRKIVRIISCSLVIILILLIGILDSGQFIYFQF
ncbi:MAG: MBOAT family O-acyltransferase [Bacteroidota bacterium]